MWFTIKRKMRKHGIRINAKEYDGWGEPCPFAKGDIYVNPKSPSISVLILTEPRASKVMCFGYKRTCWIFDAVVLRNNKSRLYKSRRVYHDELKTFVLLEDLDAARKAIEAARKAARKATPKKPKKSV